jgi:hypothetical protein
MIEAAFRFTGFRTARRPASASPASTRAFGERD